MPILPNAKKQLRKDKRKTRLNLEAKDKVKSIIKTIRGFVDSGKIDEAKKELPKAQKIIDKAAKKNLIHKKNAARKKSSLTRLVNGAGKKEASKPKSK
ncbi:30S ribosomal protein S20 [Patescibacteria group bacterium]